MGGTDRRPERLELFAVVALALATRALQSWREVVLFGDGPEFIAIARRMLEGDWAGALAHDFHPLTSLLMAGIAGASGLDLELAGRILSVVAGGVAAGGLYLLARDLLGHRVALLAGILLAGHPRAIDVSANVQSDGLYVALTCLGALAAWRTLERPRVAPALCAAIACGLAFLARPEGLAVGVVLLVWLWADAFAGRVAPRAAVRATLVFVTPALVLGGVYVIAMYGVAGDWMLTGKKSVLGMASSLGDPASVPALLAALAETSWELVRAAHPLVLVLALVGAARATPRRGALFLLCFALLFFPLLVGLHLEAGYVSRRHWMGPVALLLPLAALGGVELGARVGALLPDDRRRALAAHALLALLVAAALARVALSGEDPSKAARRSAAVWLAGSDPGSVVAAWRPRTAYYAGAARFVDLPPDAVPASGAIEGLRARGAEYVVVETARWGDSRGGVSEMHRVDYPGGSVLVLRLDPGL